MGDGRAEDLPAVVHGGVEKVIGVQHPAVAGYIQRLRRTRPAATPAEIITTLERQYLATVTGAGALLGGAAAVPGAGTGLALALSAGETAFFLETTALFTLAVAEVHAVRVAEVERRRAMVLTVMLGDGGAMLVEKAAGNAGERWGKLLADLVPMSSISTLNKTLGHWFMTQYPRNRGVMALGKILPFGIGAGIGAAGNHAFGRLIISATRRVFGPPPASFTLPADGAGPVVDLPPQAVAALTVLDSGAGEDSAAGGGEPAASEPSGRSGPTVHEPVTGKYRPLYDHLAAQDSNRVEMRFAEIMALVPGGLPKSASTRTWWANSTGSRQAKAWLAAGFAVTGVDLRSRTVQFEKRAGTS